MDSGVRMLYCCIHVWHLSSWVHGFGKAQKIDTSSKLFGCQIRRSLPHTASAESFSYGGWIGQWLFQKGSKWGVNWLNKLCQMFCTSSFQRVHELPLNVGSFFFPTINPQRNLICFAFVFSCQPAIHWCVVMPTFCFSIPDTHVFLWHCQTTCWSLPYGTKQG